MKILCTGNPQHQTVASAVQKVFPDADFASRATNYDLRMWDEKSRQHFVENIAKYDILINSSFICNGGQMKILNETVEVWKQGHIFNIGSTAEYDSKYGQYHVDKQALRARSLQLNGNRLKTTHIVASGLNDGEPGHETWIDLLSVAQTIQWILEQPFDVPLIGMEKY